MVCPRDEHHAWARKSFAQIPAGGLVCEAVLAEACHLVAKDGVPRSKVVEFVERGGLIPVGLSGELRELRDLLDRYSDTPMDFADACVVRMAELHRERVVCTVDTDFRVFRKNTREVIPLLAPFTA